MYHHMPVQMSCTLESGTAFVARVGFAIIVDQGVRLQIIWRFEFCLTKFAGEWLFRAVHPVVASEVTLALEHGPARFTLKRPVVRVGDFVRLQIHIN